MSIAKVDAFYATCDWDGCENTTADPEQGNNKWYESEEQVRSAFRYEFEGGLEDWGWLQTGDGKHYCGEHNVWDEDLDQAVPCERGHA